MHALLFVLLLGPARSLPSDLPPLHDGDLVFQRSESAQSELVALVTGGTWTHMGVVFLADGKPMVLEALEPVRETPVASWIRRGKDGRVAIKRLADDSVLTPEVVAEMHRLGESWIGKHYDPLFRWDDDRLYCSELAWKLYRRSVGIGIGTLQKARDLPLDDPRVQAEIRRRFPGGTFSPEEPVITPQSIYDDPKLATVYAR